MAKKVRRQLQASQKRMNEMLANINIRVLSNETIYAQYQKDGRAFEASWGTWASFIEWLASEVEIETKNKVVEAGQKIT